MPPVRKIISKNNAILKGIVNLLIILVIAALSGSTVYFWKQTEIKRIIAGQNVAWQSHNDSLVLQQDLAVAQNRIKELEAQNNSLTSDNNNFSAALVKYRDGALAVVSIGEDVKVGDKFGDFTVSSIGPLQSGMKMDFSDQKSHVINARINFSGEATLTGHYYFMPEGGDAAGNTICFNQLDFISELKMPRLAGLSDVWFCFGDEALTMLGEGSGKATVKIKNFSLNYYPAGGITHTAELVKVLSKE